MNKLLLIDGSNLLFQMFYGMPSRIINKNGKPIQGTLGFVGATLKIIKMTMPTHIVVLFDSEQARERSGIFEDYKANRVDYSLVPDYENPFSQLEDIYAALDYMKIKYTEVDKFETDDVISSYTLKYRDIQIVISSFDSDFFQLIDEKVNVLRYRGDKTIICDVQYVVDKFNVKPSLYADYKSLVGDKSDNIKGAEKIGSKTASWLINEFGSLEDIILNVANVSKHNIKESIIRNINRLKDNYRMIKLDGRADVPFELCELEYIEQGMSTNKILVDLGIK